MEFSISPQAPAPLEERRRLMPERIARDTMQLYRATGHVESTKAEMSRRYDAIVAERDRWWLTESCYSWLVEEVMRSAGERQSVGSL